MFLITERLLMGHKESNQTKKKSVDSEQLGPHCLPWRLLKHFSRQEKQTTFVTIDTLRAKLHKQMREQTTIVMNGRVI